MARGRASVEADQPEWIVVRPAVDDISTGGQKYLPLGGRLVAGAGLCAHQAPREDDREDELQKITAFRLELLNDPNLPLGGPGRSIKGTGALTEFEVEAAPADAPEKTSQGEDRHAPPPTSIFRKRLWKRSSTTRPKGAA